jgi:hypothetical protein
VRRSERRLFQPFILLGLLAFSVQVFLIRL